MSEDIWPYLAYFGFAPVACPAVSELGATGGASHTASHAKNLRQPVVAQFSVTTGRERGLFEATMPLFGPEKHEFMDVSHWVESTMNPNMLDATVLLQHFSD